jgi:hypothetical protein
MDNLFGILRILLTRDFRIRVATPPECCTSASITLSREKQCYLRRKSGHSDHQFYLAGRANLS